MISREQALAFILQNEKVSRRKFLETAQGILHLHPFIPPDVRAKFLQAGNQYGEFKINEDWMTEIESEVWDGVMYCGLEQLKRDLIPSSERK